MSIDAAHAAPLFAFSAGERDGLPVVALINVALANCPSCREFPWLLELEVEASEVEPSGLPTSGEADQLNAVEERIQQELTQDGGHFVARQTWNGRRMLDFYVADGRAAQRRLRDQIKQGVFVRKVTVKATKDEAWATWMPTLLRMIEPAADEGSREEPGQAVFVRIALGGGEFGSDAEQEAVLELCDALSAAIQESEAGEFDGYEFGENAAMLFAYGPDADILLAAMEPALRAARVARKATITKRYGKADDAAAREETVTLD